MYDWHGDVVALSGAAAVLSGATILSSGVDAARVRVRILHPISSADREWSEAALATDGGNGSMSLILNSTNGMRVGDQIACKIDIPPKAMPLSAKKSRNLFHVDPAALTLEDRRWLRQAVLFALEARDPKLRECRLLALGVGL